MKGATLLLNASFEPLHVVTARRAVVLVLSGKADVVSEGDGVFHSARMSVPVPSVIRLRYFVKVPYRSKMPLTRRNVVTRDKGRCAYCGDKGDTVDHVVPRSAWGESRLGERGHRVSALQRSQGRPDAGGVGLAAAPHPVRTGGVVVVGGGSRHGARMGAVAGPGRGTGRRAGLNLHEICTTAPIWAA